MARNTFQGNMTVVDRCRMLAEPIATELGLELFDVQLLREGGRLILRFVIDSEDGITHQHCEQFSKRIDPLLDEADLIAKAYFLEVSSPGVERPLRNEADFRRFIGKLVYLVVNMGVNPPTYSGQESGVKRSNGNVARRVNRNSIIEGRLTAVTDGVITVQISADQERLIPLATIKSAHLLLEQDGGERKKR